MNMAEAKQRLMDLSNGDYHCIEYKLDDHGGGSVSQTCKVYLNKYGHFEAAHWDTALAQLEDAIGGKPAISESVPVTQKEAKIA